MSAPRILFFGQLCELAGARELSRTPPAEVQTISDLQAWIASSDALLGEALKREGVRIAINRRLVHDSASVIAAGDEIAFMSPLSGG